MKEAADREAVLTYLSRARGDLKRRYSLERVAVVGSIARGDYDEESDVDIIVRFEPGTERIRDSKKLLREELQIAFGRPVQIISEKYLKPYYRSQILAEAVDV